MRAAYIILQGLVKSLSQLLCVWILLGSPGASARAASPTIRLSLDGTPITGTPLAWSNQQVMLLARDGYLWKFRPNEAADFSQVSDNFRPYSQSEMRGQLLREFGKKFDVSGTGNYLVVHPRGKRDQWATRFEELYRSFVHYFSVRGFFPESPQMPLVAIVFHSQPEFASYVRQTGGSVHPATLGFYSTKTNRIILYDVTAGQSVGENWFVNADTIIHEATHQMAFNTGVHNRFSTPPRWLAEGLATLFEARGVWNNRLYRDQPDRVNRGRLEVFQQIAASGQARGTLVPLIQDPDHWFMHSPGAAYAEAWALTYFLTEQEPARFMRYVAKTAAREPLVEYTAAERLQEFTSVFGTDLNMLEARFLRFLQKVK
jgi:hypothetical protein